VFDTAIDLDRLCVLLVNWEKATRHNHIWANNLSCLVNLELLLGSCMMVGYTEKHDCNMYWLWYHITCRVHVSRDV